MRRRLALHTPQGSSFGGVSSVGGGRRRRYLRSARALTVARAVLGLSVTHPPNNVFFPASPLLVAGIRSLCSALLPFVSRSLFNANSIIADQQQTEKVRVTDRVVLGASAVGGRTPGLRTSLLRHKTRVVTVAVVWVHVPRWICSSVGS